MDDSPESQPSFAVPDHADAPLPEIRALILAAHPDVVPEMIAGDSLDALLASIDPARQAYASLASSLSAPTVVEPPATPMPAGGGLRLAVDADALPAGEKIRRGLLSRQR